MYLSPAQLDSGQGFHFYKECGPERQYIVEVKAGGLAPHAPGSHLALPLSGWMDLNKPEFLGLNFHYW